MNIKIDNRVFEKYHNGFERQTPPNQIIIHGTGGGSSVKALVDNWILTKTFERAEAYRKGEGFPYLIDRDGTIYQLADPSEVWQYHSGTGHHDSTTIGIELVNPDASNRLGYTEKQYDALVELLTDKLLLDYEIISMSGHGAFQKKHGGKFKSCPGPEFNWLKTIMALKGKGFVFEYINEEMILK